jgi:Protein of unknown function (DUF3866)
MFQTPAGAADTSSGVPARPTRLAPVLVTWAAATVVDVLATRPGVQELATRTATGELIPALAYTDLVGEMGPGDRVALNVTAYRQHLGTGGYALVAAPDVDRLPADQAVPGRLVKARYTPTQASVAGPEEPVAGAPGLGDEEGRRTLDGLVVVLADLHSALPAVLAGLRSARPALRVSYLMSDGGALPIAFSRTVSGLLDAGWLQATVTSGQAFGGTHEAVSLHSGLLVARHVQGADVVVVSQGPGNLGTGSTWGFSGVAMGDALNASAVLGGRTIASLRISGADKRERHHGVSHHCLTAYGQVALRPADVVLPSMPGPGISTELAALVEQQIEPLAALHRLVRIDSDGLLDVLGEVPVPLSSMGRDLDGDPAYFVTAAAAGRHAAALSASA